MYKKPTKTTLDDGKVLGKNFFWRVRKWGYDPVKDKTFVDVEHWYTQDQLDADDVDIRTYTKNGLVANITTGKAENYLKTLTQYTGSIKQ